MGAMTRIDSLNDVYSFYLPLLLVVLALCNFFHVFGRIMRFFGLPRLEFADDDVEDNVTRGQQLMTIAVERRKRDPTTASKNAGAVGVGWVGWNTDDETEGLTLLTVSQQSDSRSAKLNVFPSVYGSA